jgi:hypothetical protein
MNECVLIIARARRPFPRWADGARPARDGVRGTWRRSHAASRTSRILGRGPGDCNVAPVVRPAEPRSGVNLSKLLDFLNFRGSRPAASTAQYQAASRKGTTATGGLTDPDYAESG